MNKLLAIAFLTSIVCLTQCKRMPKYAPYYYVGWPALSTDLVALKQQSGVPALTLAFALAANGCNPAFDAGAIDTPALVQQFNNFRNAGGKLIVSTGGAAGTYLDNVCGSVQDLAQAYIKAIKTTGAVGLDLDIEEDIDYTKTMSAVKIVQQQTGVPVSLTLAADQNGLGSRGKLALNAAVAAQVDIDLVNPMAMDFARAGGESSYDQSVINCAEAVKRNMKSSWPSMSDAELYSRLGVTPMIGVNDCCGAVFTLSDAQQLLNYARQHNVGHIAFWNINRDQQCPGGATGGAASATCSGQAQSQYQFAKLFAQYN